MEDTGERIVPAYHKGILIYGEHVARYQAVLPIVKQKDVLDIASGSGYGSRIMADQARSVVGVDYSADAIAYSQKTYGHKKITFKQGDATKIPVADASVDVVVSLETIEHIKDYRAFLREIRRVLRPGGQVIISTPNDREFAEGNHFHLHEFEPEEIESLLKEYFGSIAMYYQGDWQYSAILSKKDFQQEWTRPLLTLKNIPDDVGRCIYVFAVCSDGKPEPVTPLGVISQQWSDRAYIERTEEREQHVEGLRQSLQEKEADLVRVRRSLDTVLSSKSWRYTEVLRRIKHKFTPSKKR